MDVIERHDHVLGHIFLRPVIPVGFRVHLEIPSWILWSPWDRLLMSGMIDD